FVDQDIRILHLDPHLVSVGDEIGRDVAAVELHALDHFELGLERLCFLNLITPSLPTFFIASAMKRPISASPLAEIVPTCAISSFEVTSLEFFWRSATMASTARSTPRLRSIGFMPAATALAPSLTIA